MKKEKENIKEKIMKKQISARAWAAVPLGRPNLRNTGKVLSRFKMDRD